MRCAIGRRAALLATAAVALLATPASASDTSPGAEAVWAWTWDNRASVTAEVAGEGFSTAYLFSEGGFTTKVRNAIRGLSEAGVSVQALGGEPVWARPAGRDGLLRFVRQARAYQQQAPPEARLAGIHLDVEPHALPLWSEHPHNAAKEYLAALEAAVHAARGVPVYVDVPFWYDEQTYGGPRPLLDSVLDLVDGITVMAYRDVAEEIVAVSREELEAAARAGKRATLGVETARVAPERVTFYEEGRAALIAALADVRAEVGGEAGFGGLAVHHTASLAVLERPDPRERSPRRQ